MGLQPFLRRLHYQRLTHGSFEEKIIAPLGVDHRTPEKSQSSPLASPKGKKLASSWQLDKLDVPTKAETLDLGKILCMCSAG